MNQISVGSKIRWISRAGALTGKVKSIKLDLNAAQKLCPWIIVEDVENYIGMSQSNVMLNGNHDYLKMMRFEVLV